MFRFKIFFGRLGQRVMKFPPIVRFKNFCERLGQRVMRFCKLYGPVTVAAIAFVIMFFDQVTDIASTYKICFVGFECKCIWVSSRGGRCIVPGDARDWGDACLDRFGALDLVDMYCDFANNETKCNELESWGSFGTFRHPWFCLTSFLTISVPSIINSTYLYLSLLSLYKPVLRYLGLTDDSSFFRSFKKALLALYILQLLPQTWLMINFLILLKAFKSTAMKEYETWNNVLKRSKAMFCILEDSPQLMLHSIFMIHSVIKEERVIVHAGLEVLDFMSFFGVITSSASIALTLTLAKKLTTKNAFIKFITTFLSVGTRALVCSSYASSVIVGFRTITWALAIPPVAAIGLFILESLSIYVIKLLVNFRKPSIVKNIAFLTKLRIMKKIKTYVANLISLCFESSSVQCLITSYTYLVFIIALNTCWESDTRFPITQTTFIVLQYLTLASFLINQLIVQWEGKNHVRCFVYSLIFMISMIVIYFLVKEDLYAYRSLFDTSQDVSLKRIYLPQETIETLASLTITVSLAGVNTFVNLLLLIISLRAKPEVSLLVLNPNIEISLT